MGRRGSKITFDHCVLHHFSSPASWWRPFRSKPLFLTNYEKAKNSNKKDNNKTNKENVKIIVLDRNRRHHEARLEKWCRMQWSKVLFEPRRRVSWTFLHFWLRVDFVPINRSTHLKMKSAKWVVVARRSISNNAFDTIIDKAHGIHLCQNHTF